MSDYFGALMQSSGLSIEKGAALRPGVTPQDPAFPADYGIVEVDEQGSMVHGDASANKTDPPIPAQGQLGSADGQGAVQPRGEVAPMPSAVEKVRSVAIAPLVQVQQADSTDSVEADGRAHHEASSGANAPSRFHGKEPLPVGSAVVEAALRWVASGEDHTRAAPVPASVRPQRSDSPVVFQDVQAPQTAEAPISDQESEERPDSARSSSFLRLGQPHAVEVPEALRDSDQHPRESARDSVTDNVVEVTIGSINVHVDAPPPPAVTAPSPISRGTADTPPRSGLSRRTLWRI
jgi:hypothetical protein